MIKIIFTIVFATLTLQWSTASIAKGVYLEPEKFLEQAFENEPPKPEKIWITKELKSDIKSILGNDLKVIRLR